jgi:hypothetical protein
MNLLDKVTIPAQVMARQVGEETVILDLASGTYFGLDPVGGRIWQSMSEGRTLAEVCAAMLAEYEVTPEDIERDVLRLAEELRAKQLIDIA